MSYIGRRLLRALLLLIGVSALCFLFSEMAPGSFFDEMRLNPQISPETILALRSRYGLDQPLAGEIWQVGEICAARRSRIFHRLQPAGRAIVVEPREKHSAAHDDGIGSDLAHLRSSGCVDGQPARRIAG